MTPPLPTKSRAALACQRCARLCTLAASRRSVSEPSQRSGTWTCAPVIAPPPLDADERTGLAGRGGASSVLHGERKKIRDVSLCQAFSKTPSSGHPDPSQTRDAARVHREACNKPHEARRQVHLHGRFAGFRAVRCVVLCEPALTYTPARPTHTGLRSPHQQPTTHFFSLPDPSACLEHRSHSPLNRSSALRRALSHSHLNTLCTGASQEPDQEADPPLW